MKTEISLDDVYRKFGEVSEAAQLLETELGNILLMNRVTDSLRNEENPEKAIQILEHVNRCTLGQLLWQLQGTHDGLDQLEEVLSKAKLERNRLSHSFYRQHNFRRNSSEGQSIMLQDLSAMHETILDAYKAVLKLSGFDIEKIKLQGLPSGHMPI